MAKKKTDSKDALLVEAKDAFDEAQEAETENRERYQNDMRFAMKGEQWPERIVRQRQRENRPCLTINKLKPFTRQITNDIRQNKPAIKTHPVDDGADRETSKVMNGIIRHIEYTSNAIIAYQTGAEGAVQGGFGYWRVDMDYAREDSFDLNLAIDRIVDPTLIYADPSSTAADSSDWDTAFEVEMLSDKKFEKAYKKAEKVDWEMTDYAKLKAPWREGDSVMVAKWWKREEVEKDIYLLSDGTVVDDASLKSPDVAMAIQAGGLKVTNQRTTIGYKVKRYTLTGAEVLDEEDWVGRYIPIVPVFGEEVWIDGERRLESLIHPAKDAQRMYNYWRSTGTELIALAPRVPFIGPKGAFKSDPNWSTANTISHPYLEFDGPVSPMRQPLDTGGAAGAMTEALTASDDMKAIIGMYDASLGMRSNETSGKAILARQREGDVSTFHFADNMSRAIRHTGRILIDLIPHVYNKPRIARIMGEDGQQDEVKINQPINKLDRDKKPMQNQDGSPIMQMHNIATGKYDLTVSPGPSFTTRREEASTAMTELIRSYPDAAPVVAPLLAKNLDWPGADEIAERFEAMVPPAAKGGPPPELKKVIQDGMEKIKGLEEQAQKDQVEMTHLKLQHEVDQFRIEQAKFEAGQAGQNGDVSRQLQDAELALKRSEADIKRYEAETKRIQADPPAETARQALAAMMEMQSAPKQIIRDENDEIIGVQTIYDGNVINEQQVVRDENGEVVGVGSGELN